MTIDEIQDGQYFYWGPYLWTNKITDKLSKTLLEKGLKLTKSHNDKLAGQLDYEKVYDVNDRVWFSNEIQPYLQKYISNGFYWYSKFINNRKFYISLESLWINVMKNGEYNPEHIHDADLSFVIYLSVPDLLKEENKKYVGRSAGPGSIEFSYGEANQFVLCNHGIFPEKNQIFIFPANLRHMVSPFKSNCERISVSGNFKFNFYE